MDVKSQKICLLPPDHFNYSLACSIRSQRSEFSKVMKYLELCFGLDGFFVKYRSINQSFLFPVYDDVKSMVVMDEKRLFKESCILIGPPCSMIFQAEVYQKQYIVFEYGIYDDLVTCNQVLKNVASSYPYAANIEELSYFLQNTQQLVSKNTSQAIKSHKSSDEILPSLSSIINNDS